MLSGCFRSGACEFDLLHRPTKIFFVKRQRMLNGVGVKSGALGPKMHLVLSNWL